VKLSNLGGIEMKRTNNRRTPKQEHYWSVLSKEGELLLKAKTFHLPLSDEIILKKCIEIFDDTDPCYIHRSAVMNRLYYEIEEAAGQLPQGERLLISKLPDPVSEYLELPKSADFVILS
jgi:hypothetical protein